MSSWKRIVFPLVAAVVVVAAMGAWQLPQVRASLLGPARATLSATAQQQPRTGKPFIGISLVNNSAQVKDRLGLSTDQGVVIARVAKDSPGEKAGLLEKDVITAIDGTAVKSAKDVTSAVQAKKVGDQVKLTINRGGTPQDLTVTLGSTPERPQAGKRLPFAGGLGGFLGGNPRDNLRSGKIELTDKDGKIRTIEIVAGTVQSASSTGISVVPNGDTVTRTFQVTKDTRSGRGKVEDLKQGDKVVVVGEGGNALSVLGGNPAMRGPNGAPGGPRMMPFHPFGPRTGGPPSPAPKAPVPSSFLGSL